MHIEPRWAARQAIAFIADNNDAAVETADAVANEHAQINVIVWRTIAITRRVC
jgi:hypothetical protein